jgi:hypothetical protein
MNLVSLERLADKLSKPSFTVVVIGGSMTTGFQDYSHDNDDTFSIAFPKKLEDFLQYQWQNIAVKVINLAEGGADEKNWLAKLDYVMEFEPDIILVESAVNDQCNYDEQDQRYEYVNSTSLSLLNLLMHFPQHPAVINVLGQHT